MELARLLLHASEYDFVTSNIRLSYPYCCLQYLVAGTDDVGKCANQPVFALTSKNVFSRV